MISIIIPVFRVQPYIEKCMESILEQQNADFEVIVVNDSTDDLSMDICRKLTRCDERFRVIDLSNNVGVGIARNVGLKYAKGEYIYFLDSDDYLCPDSISKMATYAKPGIDLIRSECILFYDGMETGRWKFDEKKDNFEKINMYSCYLYSAVFLEKHRIRFPSLHMAQDQVFLLNVMTNDPECIDIDSPSFCYCRYSQRFNRMRYTTTNVKDHLKAEQEMLDILIQRDAYSYTDAVCRSIEKMVKGADRFIPYMDIAEQEDYHYELIKLEDKLNYSSKFLNITVQAKTLLQELIAKTEGQMR